MKKKGKKKEKLETKARQMKKKGTKKPETIERAEDIKRIWDWE